MVEQEASVKRELIVAGSAGPVVPDRWLGFVTALREELARSGVGELLEPSAGQGGGTQEIAIALAQPERGRELVDRMLSQHGLPPRCSVLPERWRGFRCDDYFASRLATDGHYDTESQYLYVFPRHRIHEDEEREFLVVGGCDVCAWGYRRDRTGVWAWYPIDAEFKLLAPGIEALLAGWLAGTIRV
jgi:hypothetical protein